MRIFRSRRGQTTLEYIMTTLALLFVFTVMYRFFGYNLPKLFKAGAKVILTEYEVSPW